MEMSAGDKLSDKNFFTARIFIPMGKIMFSFERKIIYWKNISMIILRGDHLNAVRRV